MKLAEKLLFNKIKEVDSILLHGITGCGKTCSLIDFYHDQLNTNEDFKMYIFDFHPKDVVQDKRVTIIKKSMFKELKALIKEIKRKNVNDKYYVIIDEITFLEEDGNDCTKQLLYLLSHVENVKVICTIQCISFIKSIVVKNFDEIYLLEGLC